MCTCSCLTSRPCGQEYKLWLLVSLLSTIAIVVPIVAGASVLGTLVGYGSFFGFMSIMSALIGRFFNGAFFPKYAQSKKRLDGKTAIVTGGNSGCGYCTAKEFYKRGGNVVLTCRSEAKATTTIARIKDECDDASGAKVGTLDYVVMDLLSKKSVDAAADAILNVKKLEVTILVNNAGGMIGPRITEDGLEAQMQANYQAPFYLTKRLLPNIKATAAKNEPQFGRITNVASLYHRYATKEVLEAFIGNGDSSEDRRADLEFWKKTVSGNDIYGSNKAGNIMHAMKLQELFDEEGIGGYLHAVSVHPGYVNSGFFRGVGKAGWGPKIGFLFFYPWQAMFSMLSPNQGAQTSIHCTLSDEQVKPGGYHAACRPASTHSGVDSLLQAKKDDLYNASDTMWTEAEA